MGRRTLLALAGVLIVITTGAKEELRAHVSYVLDLPGVQIVVRT
jgi:hypothetical protein